ncbi:DUF5995 family protein [Chitinophagaceae bacterium MMS25-I14]
MNAPAAMKISPHPIPALPQTINETITQLAGVLQYCIDTNHRAGYFTALYYRVTCRVKEGILNNEFDDGPRMERFDVIFASRFLEAWYQWQAGQKPTESWRIAFEAAEKKDDIVLQHLLLGMNAHINLDLGIAAVATMNDENILPLQGDFNKINALLGSLVGAVEDCLTKINPLMRLLALHKWNYDELLVQFSMDQARQGAWDFATTLDGKQGNVYDDCISGRDKKIAELAANLARPDSWLLRLTVRFIRLYEKRNVADVIRLMNS